MTPSSKSGTIHPVIAEVMDAMPQMKGWREAKIGWRIWTQEAIERTLASVPAVPCDDAAVERGAKVLVLNAGRPMTEAFARRLAEEVLRAAGETP